MGNSINGRSAPCSHFIYKYILEMLDTTIRPICFGIPNQVQKEQAALVGPEKL